MPHKVMTKQEIQKLVELGLEANGCNKENSSAVARTIAAAELDGCAAHGLFRMPGYVASLRSGKVNGNASPVVSRLSPGVVKVDGDHGDRHMYELGIHEPCISCMCYKCT